MIELHRYNPEKAKAAETTRAASAFEDMVFSLDPRMAISEGRINAIEKAETPERRQYMLNDSFPSERREDMLYLADKDQKNRPVVYYREMSMDKLTDLLRKREVTTLDLNPNPDEPIPLESSKIGVGLKSMLFSYGLESKMNFDGFVDLSVRDMCIHLFAGGLEEPDVAVVAEIDAMLKDRTPAICRAFFDKYIDTIFMKREHNGSVHKNKFPYMSASIGGPLNKEAPQNGRVIAEMVIPEDDVEASYIPNAMEREVVLRELKVEWISRVHVTADQLREEVWGNPQIAANEFEGDLDALPSMGHSEYRQSLTKMEEAMPDGLREEFVDMMINYQRESYEWDTSKWGEAHTRTEAEAAELEKQKEVLEFWTPEMKEQVTTELRAVYEKYAEARGKKFDQDEFEMSLLHEQQFVLRVLRKFDEWKDDKNVAVVWDIDRTLGKDIKFDSKEKKEFVLRPSMVPLLEHLVKKYPNVYHGILSDRRKILEQLEGEYLGADLSAIDPYISRNLVFEYRDFMNVLEFEEGSGFTEDEQSENSRRMRDAGHVASRADVFKLAVIDQVSAAGVSVKNVDDINIAEYRKEDGLHTYYIQPYLGLDEYAF